MKLYLSYKSITKTTLISASIWFTLQTYLYSETPSVVSWLILLAILVTYCDLRKISYLLGFVDPIYLWALRSAKNLNITCPKPVYLLLGLKGCGKTTLMNNAGANCITRNQPLADTQHKQTCWQSQEAYFIEKTCSAAIQPHNRELPSYWKYLHHILTHSSRSFGMQGCVVVIAADILFSKSQSKAQHEFDLLNTELNHFLEHFKSKPLHLIITKVDHLEGFYDVFQSTDQSFYENPFGIHIKQSSRASLDTLLTKLSHKIENLIIEQLELKRLIDGQLNFEKLHQFKELFHKLKNQLTQRIQNNTLTKPLFRSIHLTCHSPDKYEIEQDIMAFTESSLPHNNALSNNNQGHRFFIAHLIANLIPTHIVIPNRLLSSIALILASVNILFMPLPMEFTPLKSIPTWPTPSVVPYVSSTQVKKDTIKSHIDTTQPSTKPLFNPRMLEARNTVSRSNPVAKKQISNLALSIQELNKITTCDLEQYDCVSRVDAILSMINGQTKIPTKKLLALNLHEQKIINHVLINNPDAAEDIKRHILSRIQRSIEKTWLQYMSSLPKPATSDSILSTTSNYNQILTRACKAINNLKSITHPGHTMADCIQGEHATKVSHEYLLSRTLDHLLITPLNINAFHKTIRYHKKHLPQLVKAIQKSLDQEQTILDNSGLPKNVTDSIRSSLQQLKTVEERTLDDYINIILKATESLDSKAAPNHQITAKILAKLIEHQSQNPFIQILNHTNISHLKTQHLLNLNQEWSTHIMPVFSKNLLNHFPFNPQGVDSDLNTFTNFFRPNSKLDLFFQQYILPFTQRKHHDSPMTWKQYHGKNLFAHETPLNLLMITELIQKIYFSKSDDHPLWFEGTIYATSKSQDIDHLLMTINHIDHPIPDRSTNGLHLKWPLADSIQIKAKLKDGTVQTLHDSKGPWALIKLLQQLSNSPQIPNDHYELNLHRNHLDAQLAFDTQSKVTPIINSISESFLPVNPLLPS
ncbi:MAG: type VI secretion protein IcmF/TssM N-terminal domain-containing protein [Pseudomonadota bacterium]|nr:type VI secretion protein IcmF/TssM N-terminal domain-containing protein [Pseudomonadota bacterium]